MYWLVNLFVKRLVRWEKEGLGPRFLLKKLDLASSPGYVVKYWSSPTSCTVIESVCFILCIRGDYVFVRFLFAFSFLLSSSPSRRSFDCRCAVGEDLLLNESDEDFSTGSISIATPCSKIRKLINISLNL